MKAVILHGTANDHTGNWFPWLKQELLKLGLEDVWVPDLPGSGRPDIKRYTEYLLSKNWDFKNNLLVGHSSGSVEIMGLLLALPEGITIDTAVLVGTYKGDLGRDDLRATAADFDYQKIKSKAKKFIVVHSDNDPYCPLDGAKWVAQQLDAKFVLMPGFAHFGIQQDPKFKEFPELLQIIKEEVV
jgi:predicted alpha/beta hydrolase family esterase